MISKNKQNIQISLSRDSVNTLNNIVKELSQKNITEITKSQAIEYLINNYFIMSQQPKIIIKEDKQPKQLNEYQKGIKLLKIKLNTSFKKLAEKIGIPESTLKKLDAGIQKPSENNKELLLKAFKDYKINPEEYKTR